MEEREGEGALDALILPTPRQPRCPPNLPLLCRANVDQHSARARWLEMGNNNNNNNNNNNDNVG